MLSLDTKGRKNAVEVTYEDAMGAFAPRNPKSFTEPLKKFVDTSKGILDIGANTGFWCKMVMEHIGFDGPIHMIEPVPNLSKHARRTCDELFSDKDCTVHNFGLSDQAGEMSFWIDLGGNFGWNTLVEEKAKNARKPMKEIKVKMKTFDELGIGLAHFGVIKIDTEGNEFRVLRGMKESLKKARPPLYIEVGWGKNHPNWAEEKVEFQYLYDLGYKTYDRSGRPMAKEHLFEINSTQDVIFSTI
jgi:FkbM family methyltransferase